jgi:hypothetical protein
MTRAVFLGANRTKNMSRGEEDKKTASVAAKNQATEKYGN